MCPRILLSKCRSPLPPDADVGCFLFGGEWSAVSACGFEQRNTHAHAKFPLLGYVCSLYGGMLKVPNFFLMLASFTSKFKNV